MEDMNKELLAIAENIIKDKIADAKQVLILVYNSKDEPKFVFKEMTIDNIIEAGGSISETYQRIKNGDLI